MALHAKLLTSVLVLVIISLEANGARIIGVLSTDSKSRYANLRNLAEELGLKKHEVCKSFLILRDLRDCR